MRSILQLGVMFVALAVGLLAIIDLAVQGDYDFFFPESGHYFKFLGSLRIIHRLVKAFKKVLKGDRP